MLLHRQFIRFAFIGGAGFLVDVAVLYLLHAAGFNLYIARLVSFTVAATATWMGNRHFTFGLRTDPRAGVCGEWLRYILAMTAGGLVNYSVYAILIYLLIWFRDQLWLAVAAGTGAGMLLNFALARRLLYQRAI